MINLQPKEKLLYEAKPDPKLLTMYLIRNPIYYAIFFMIAIGWMPILYGSLGIFNITAGAYVAIYLLGLIIPTALIALYQIPLVKSFKYYITNQRIYAESGVFTKRNRSVQFQKLTDVGKSQGVLDQMFGLSNLHMHTAGMGVTTAEISFIGLSEVDTPENLIRKKLNNNK